VLNRAVNAAQQAGVACGTIQVEHAQPYRAIIAAAADRGCNLIVMASHGRGGIVCGPARQRDKQGFDAHENSDARVSLNALRRRLS